MSQRYVATAWFGARLGGYPGWGSGWMNRYPGVVLPKEKDFTALGCIPPLPAGPPYKSKIGVKLEAAVWSQSGSSTTCEILLGTSSYAADDGWSDYVSENGAWYNVYPYVLATFSLSSTTLSTVNIEPVEVPKFGSEEAWCISRLYFAGSSWWHYNGYYPWIRVVSGGVYLKTFELIELPGQVPRGLSQGDEYGRTVAWENDLR